MKQTPLGLPAASQPSSSLYCITEYNVAIHSDRAVIRINEGYCDGPGSRLWPPPKKTVNIPATVSQLYDVDGPRPVINMESSRRSFLRVGRRSKPGVLHVRVLLDRRSARIEKVTGIPTENYESFQVLRYQLDKNTERTTPVGPIIGWPAVRAPTPSSLPVGRGRGGETEFPLIKRPSGTTIRQTDARPF